MQLPAILYGGDYTGEGAFSGHLLDGTGFRQYTAEQDSESGGVSAQAEVMDRVSAALEMRLVWTMW
ncbi:hypothetical protein AGMMS50225_04710 [Betaproteobacteria bacterium]|nr:hypothetical protein AGMMS50225_04710 [Betaproteobacteria bacterium]